MSGQPQKMLAFLPAGGLHLIPCLFHVLTIYGMCPTKPQTMSGFPSVPSGTASQTI